MATAAPTSQFTGVDFLNFDTLLSEEERAVRDTVRTWVDENLIPVIGEAYIEGQFPEAAHRRHGRAGALRGQPAGGVRLRRAQQRGVRPHHAGAGAGRLGDPVLRLGAGRAGDVPDLRLRVRRAEEEVAAAAGVGAGDRLLRADRAGLRVQPRRHDHHRAGDQGRLGAQRHQDVDHQRLPGHGVGHLGQDRETSRIPKYHPRLHRSHRHQGVHGQGPEGEAFAPRQRHQRDPSPGRAPAEGRDPAQVGRAQEPAHVPHPGPLRHRLGRDRRGDGVLRRGAPLRAAAG